VTVPESNEHADGTLLAATRLEVTLADAGNTALVGTSTPVDVWVDSAAPTLTVNTPSGLCGSFDLSSTAVTQAVSFNAENGGVSVQLTNGSSTTTYNTPTFATGVATFSNVLFNTGENDLVVTATDPAGNSTTLTPNPCMVTVGAAPVVTFTIPVAGAVLCPVGSPNPGCLIDSQSATPGWQGDVSVHATIDGQPLTGVNVTFMVGTTTLGMASLDIGGNATLVGVTLPNGVVTVVATTDNVQNRGVGTASVTVNVVDDIPPTAVTGLQVSVTDRRKTTMRLTWTAPGDSGAAVSGYAIRYAKIPITTSNFDDSTTSVVTYTGTPASPGQLDGIDVSPLYIENDYYFAIAALDAAGNRSPIVATPNPGTCTCLAGACCAAHFNMTTLSAGAGTGIFGSVMNGEGDLNGDGVSDLLVGTGGGVAYLFFGGANFAGGAPAVTFTGSGASFGLAVSQIGDIDADGLPDLAISDPTGTTKVYIYKGRTSWPATLTDAQADYVIGGDSSYAGSQLGISLARLGDFTGDGVDDLAIGARNRGPGIGRVVIIRGRNGFTSVNLPDTTNAITIDGDASLGRPLFGTTLVGLGHFYTGGPTTLIVGAPGSTSSATANMGHVYAFHGQNGTPGAISLSSADQVIAGTASGTQIGLTLANLGPLVGGFPTVGIGNPVDFADVSGSAGTGFVMFGTPTTGPLTSKTTVIMSGGNLVGPVILGGGLSGQDARLSFIGDSTPDLLFTAEMDTFVTLSDGATFPSGGMVDVTTSAQVKVPLPAGWAIGPNGGSVVKDVDGDGYPDFAIRKAVAPGSVGVFW
jgi:hypothetical protein